MAGRGEKVIDAGGAVEYPFAVMNRTSAHISALKPAAAVSFGPGVDVWYAPTARNGPG